MEKILREICQLIADKEFEKLAALELKSLKLLIAKGCSSCVSVCSTSFI